LVFIVNAWLKGNALPTGIALLFWQIQLTLAAEDYDFGRDFSRGGAKSDSMLVGGELFHNYYFTKKGSDRMVRAFLWGCWVRKN